MAKIADLCQFKIVSRLNMKTLYAALAAAGLAETLNGTLQHMPLSMHHASIMPIPLTLPPPTYPIPHTRPRPIHAICPHQ